MLIDCFLARFQSYLYQRWYIYSSQFNKNSSDIFFSLRRNSISVIG